MRIAEISTGRIVVVTDDYGAASAIGASLERIELPWPAPAELRAEPTAPDR